MKRLLVIVVLILVYIVFGWSQYPPGQALPDAYYLGVQYSLLDSTEHGLRFTQEFADALYRALIRRQLTDWKAYTEECESERVKHDRCAEGYAIAEGWRFDADTVSTWTDSNAVGYWGAHDCGTPGCTVAQYHTMPRYYWTHQEGKRPDLPGFMLYLERKYPQKGVKP